MGFADIKLTFVLGMYLPVLPFLYSIYWAFLTGGLISAILVIAKRKSIKQTIAFGPFIIIGFLFEFYKFIHLLK